MGLISISAVLIVFINSTQKLIFILFDHQEILCKNFFLQDHFLTCIIVGT